MVAAGLIQGKKNEESETNGNTQAPVAVSEPASVRSSVTVDEGRKYLRLLVAEEVWKRGHLVSIAFIDKAIEGNPTALRVLQEFLERPKTQKPEKPARQGRSLAEIWAAEPLWDESSEETAEVGAGGREPEG